MRSEDDAIWRYLRLGLALGRHVEGFVDAYYGPPELADQAGSRPAEAPALLAEQARRLLADLDNGRAATVGSDGALAVLEPDRRAWLAAQVRGLHTSARRLAGESIAYLDEIEQCYGSRPEWAAEEGFAEAHHRLQAVLPGGPGGADLAGRYERWRESQVVPPGRMETAMRSLAEDFRARTDRLFGLPGGERVDFEVVTDKPWSGFNYYLGGLRSRVALNADLPVHSTTLGHVVAHESYPGHHTEHCRKEIGLVRSRHHLEETIFLVGTPQCLIAEGLADLALEVVTSGAPEPVLDAHFRSLGVPYDAGLAGEVGRAVEALGAVRGNVAIGIHDRGWSAEEATAYLSRWALVSQKRAAQQLRFLTDPTWRAYSFCYIDGLRLCRRFVGQEPARFERLLTDQLVPDQLVAA